MTKTDQNQDLLQLRAMLQQRIDELDLRYSGDQIDYAIQHGREVGYRAVLADIDRLLNHVHPEPAPRGERVAQ